MREREDLVIAIAASVEKDFLILIFLRVQNVVTEICFFKTKKN